MLIEYNIIIEIIILHFLAKIILMFLIKINNNSVILLKK